MRTSKSPVSLGGCRRMITVAASFGLTTIFLNCWDSNIPQIVLEDLTPKHHKRRGAKDVYDLSYFTLKESHLFVNPFIAEPHTMFIGYTNELFLTGGIYDNIR
jgi:hypothetical protein